MWFNSLCFILGPHLKPLLFFPNKLFAQLALLRASSFRHFQALDFPYANRLRQRCSVEYLFICTSALLQNQVYPFSVESVKTPAQVQTDSTRGLVRSPGGLFKTGIKRKKPKQTEERICTAKISLKLLPKPGTAQGSRQK